MVVMGYYNFKDEALIKKQQVCQKMNETGMKLKNESKWSNHRKLFLFATGSCVFFQSSEVHKSMNAKRLEFK
jgi:uncharacterized Rmd1/YagE family protein